MIDLHLHTSASDGSYSPKKLVEAAKAKGLKTIAITDHDTVDALEQAVELGESLGIEVINGIEFSTEYKGLEVHILGYFFDRNNPILLDKLKELKLDRERRTELMLKKLEKYKLYISMEELLEEVEGELISRTHIANAMIKKGYVYSRKEAFDVYLKANGAAYIPKENIDPFEAIEIINKSGGVASLAHPKLIGLDKGAFEVLLEKLVGAGLGAIEAYYPSFAEKDINYYKKLIGRYKLLVTGGSDFHGLNRPGIDIGSCGISDEELDNLRKARL